MTPRVSVITAAYNAEPWIGEALASLLAQTLTAWECIVIDDGSTDRTAAVARETGRSDGRIRVKRTTNQGQGFARNVGLEMAKGDYIVYLDADDRLAPDYLARAVAWLDAHDGCAVWYSRSVRFGEGLADFTPFWMRWTSYRGLLRTCCIYISAVHRRRDALRIGGFAVTHGFEDWDYWIRLLAGKPDDAVTYDDTTLGLIYRVRPDSTYQREKGNRHALTRAMRRRNADIYDGTRARATTYRRDPRVLVVIPYLAEGAQGHELLWAALGWYDHFREPFTLCIVGDEPPKDVPFDVWVDCPRVAPVEGQYLPHIDIVHKFRAVREAFPDANGFVYSCDDIYAVNDFGFEDIAVPKCNADDIRALPTAEGWHGDAARTKAWLTLRGLPTREWVCHLPVYYEWDKWEAVVDELHADTLSYVIEDVYFNEWYSTRPAVMMGRERNPYRVRVETPDFDAEALRDEMRRKTWVCNAVGGYCGKLVKALDNYYGV